MYNLNIAFFSLFFIELMKITEIISPQRKSFDILLYIDFQGHKLFSFWELMLQRWSIRFQCCQMLENNTWKKINFKNPYITMWQSFRGALWWKISWKICKTPRKHFSWCPILVKLLFYYFKYKMKACFCEHHKFF